jgi:hypothetical protein
MVRRTKTGIVVRCLLAGSLTIVLAADMIAEGPKGVPPAAGFREVALPFIARHCLECHG